VCLLPGIFYGIEVAIFPFSTYWEQMPSAQFSSEVTDLIETEVTAREQIAQEQTQIRKLKRLISETYGLICKNHSGPKSNLQIIGQDIERALKEIAVLLDTLKSVTKHSTTVLINGNVKILQHNNVVK
jgi:hypothetical protein